MQWIYVSLPHATFALAVRDGHVVDAAPIARWAIGKDERYVADYYRRRGARFERIGDVEVQVPPVEPRPPC